MLGLSRDEERFARVEEGTGVRVSDEAVAAHRRMEPHHGPSDR